MSFRLDHAALRRIVDHSPESRALFGKVARDIRDRARVNAESVSSKTDAIATELGVDDVGIYADIGYKRNHPGFFLWWHEVGTRNHPPTPHLRPAVRPNSI